MGKNEAREMASMIRDLRIAGHAQAVERREKQRLSCGHGSSGLAALHAAFAPLLANETTTQGGQAIRDICISSLSDIEHGVRNSPGTKATVVTALRLGLRLLVLLVLCINM